MRRLIFFCIFSLFILFGFCRALPLNEIKLPQGFHISIYATVPNARSMALGKNGIVFVGTRKSGKVYALVPAQNFSKAEKVIQIAQNLNQPNGVAYYKNDLYVAEITTILRYKNIEANLTPAPKPTVVTDKLPTAVHHGWRYIGFGPKGWLYVAIGAPCNICIKKDPRFASLSRMKPDGSDFQLYATGIRNSVGFDWDPNTHYLWFSENGRDWLGNDIPPDEINVAPKKGLNFGFPYYYGNRIADPHYAKRPSSANMVVPAYELPAHCAPLGLRFYTGTQFPQQYHHSIFVAEHGSWNRLGKVGYQVINLQVKGKKVISKRVFATGWLQGQTDWGRPVDVLMLPDGSLLISDDDAGVVYRVYYL